jgi:hypothetical protein
MCASIVSFNKSFNPCESNIGLKWNIATWMYTVVITDISFIFGLSAQVIWQHAQSNEIDKKYEIIFRISRAIYVAIDVMIDILGLLLVLNYNSDCHDKQHQLWIFAVDILIARCCRYAIVIFGLGIFVYNRCKCQCKKSYMPIPTHEMEEIIDV